MFRGAGKRWKQGYHRKDCWKKACHSRLNLLALVVYDSWRELTQACFVVLKWVCEVEVAMKLSIIKLHGHGMMCLLVNRPDSTGQVQTWDRVSQENSRAESVGHT